MSRRDRNELTDIAAELRHETDGAYLICDGAVEAWVPKSIAQDNEDGTFTMPLWFAKDKGFI
jgi:hypothetical protein